MPESQYMALTSHFLSLVFSDCHLIQSGRSRTWPAACTESWGFDRQFFLGNCLCNGCTEQHSATKLFDVSTRSEAIWKNCDDQQVFVRVCHLGETLWFLQSAEVHGRLLSVTAAKHPSHMAGMHLRWVAQRCGSCLCTLLSHVLRSPVPELAWEWDLLRGG